MKISLIALFIAPLMGLCTLRGSATFANEWKGHTAINETLKARMLIEGAQFHFGSYLGYANNPGFGGLLDLLGTYGPATGAPHTGLKNGGPNSINVLLWFVAIQAFSEDLSKICLEARPTTPLHQLLHPSFAAIAQGMCKRDLSSEEMDRALEAYWFAVMDWDAPLTEFSAWSEFAKSEAIRSLSPQAALSTLTQAILNNPYFLLKD